MLRRAFCLSALFLIIGASTGVSAATQSAPDSVTITFRRVFKSSFPEFVEIKINDAGAGTYDIRQLSDAADPASFEVNATLARRLFDLAQKLQNFEGVNLEIPHRIANLGEKTFTYQSGAASHSTSFNYTTDQTAQQLLQMFEGLIRQLSDISDLQHALHYDRLGVNDVLLQIEKDYEAKQLPEPERLVPLLGQVSADQRVIDMARKRARDLAARIDAAH